jgi:general stress protein 26
MDKVARYTKDAKKVIDKIEYIDLATVTSDGRPWNSPLWFARDSKYNFYFYSPKYTQHAKNVRNNGKGFVIIYDSTAPEGTGFGVYMRVNVRELKEEKEVEEAFRWVFKGKKKGSVKDFIGKTPRRMYKVTPQKVWVNDAEIKNDLYLDYRVEIKLK